MDDLEQRIGIGWKKRLKEELLATGKLYFDVIKNPSLLAKGAYQVVRDIVYELPKSLISNKFKKEDLEKRLNENASQALTLSEVATIPGTFIGVYLLKILGADDYTASVIGGDVGNYVSGALSYLLAYTLLTRRNKGYSVKEAFVDSCRVAKDCFPAAMALYLGDAPTISGLLAAGLPRNLAVGLNLALGMIIFTGVVKYSASQNVKRI